MTTSIKDKDIIESEIYSILYGYGATDDFIEKVIASGKCYLCDSVEDFCFDVLKEFQPELYDALYKTDKTLGVAPIDYFDIDKYFLLIKEKFDEFLFYSNHSDRVLFIDKYRKF
jgi:hypothetical protein